jgi:hypothetical protein
MMAKDKAKKKDDGEIELQTIRYAGVDIVLPQEVVQVAACGKDVLTFVDVMHAFHALSDYNIVRAQIGAPQYHFPFSTVSVPGEEPNEDEGEEEGAEEGSNVAAE